MYVRTVLTLHVTNIMSFWSLSEGFNNIVTCKEINAKNVMFYFNEDLTHCGKRTPRFEHLLNRTLVSLLVTKGKINKCE